MVVFLSGKETSDRLKDIAVISILSIPGLGYIGWDLANNSYVESIVEEEKVESKNEREKSFAKNSSKEPNKNFMKKEESDKELPWLIQKWERVSPSSLRNEPIDDYLKVKGRSHDKLEGILDPYMKFYNSYPRKWLPHMRQVMKDYGDTLREACNIYDIPTGFYLAMIGVEMGKPSSDYPTGDSRRSYTGAVGFAQLFPAATIDALNFTKREGYKDSMLYSMDREEVLKGIRTNPETNIFTGAAYIRYLYEERSGENWTVAAQMYNSGPSRVAKVLHYHKGIETGEWWPPIYLKGRAYYSNMTEYLNSKEDWSYMDTYSTGAYEEIELPANKDYAALVLGVATQKEVRDLVMSGKDFSRGISITYNIISRGINTD